MQQFQITSNKMPGHILISFNEDGLLAAVDFTNSGANFEQVAYLIRKMPVLYESLEPFCQQTKLEAVQAEYEVTFEMFWNDYGYKVERKRTETLWKALSKLKQVKAHLSIAAYKRFLKRKKIEQKYPDTYLRSEAFETEWDKVQ